jgi:hypothetical protein
MLHYVKVTLGERWFPQTIKAIGDVLGEGSDLMVFLPGHVSKKGKAKLTYSLEDPLEEDVSSRIKVIPGIEGVRTGTCPTTNELMPWYKG